MTDTPDESERPPDTPDASGRSVADAIDATDAPPESVVTAPSIDVTSLLDDALRHASMGVVLVGEAGVIVLATPAAGSYSAGSFRRSSVDRCRLCSIQTLDSVRLRGESANRETVGRTRS